MAVASIPNECAQTVISDHSKDYLSSGTEGSNKECVIAVRSGAMRPCDGLQITQQSQFREVEWRLMSSCWKAISIGTGREVNDRSLGTCGGTKQPKHNNISGIDGVGVKRLLSPPD
jgi:hypothetical protein